MLTRPDPIVSAQGIAMPDYTGIVCVVLCEKYKTSGTVAKSTHHVVRENVNNYCVFLIKKGTLYLINYS